MNYEVHLTLFEGPFDLLLFFIERDELDIHEVSLASITGDFLAYIQSMNALNLELASEFIWVAATLMKIKARQLIPRPKLDMETEGIESEQDLMQRLIQYKKFKEVLPEFLIREENRLNQFKKILSNEEIKRFGQFSWELNPLDDLKNLSLYQLLLSYQRVLNRNLEKKEEIPHSIQLVSYTIEEQKTKILRLVELNQRIDFELIKSKSTDKLELVYSFMAILELVQEQSLNLQVGLGLNNFWVSSL